MKILTKLLSITSLSLILNNCDIKEKQVTKNIGKEKTELQEPRYLEGIVIDEVITRESSYEKDGTFKSYLNSYTIIANTKEGNYTINIERALNNPLILCFS